MHKHYMKYMYSTLLCPMIRIKEVLVSLGLESGVGV